MLERFKKILLSFFVRISGNVISKILGLVTLPFISRALGPEGYGDYNYIITIISYTAILVNWGYIPYGTRETAKYSDASQIVNNIISARYTLGLLSIILGVLGFSIAFWNNPSFLINIFIAFGIILAQLLNIEFYFYGKKSLLIPTISQLIGQIVFVVGVVLFIRNINDLRLLLILYVFYQLLGSIVMLVYYLQKSSLKINFSIHESFNSLKKTFILGASGRIENLTSTYPILIIPLFFKTNFELGLFSSAYLFFTIVLIGYQTVMIILAPYIVDLKNKPLLFQRKIILLTLGFLFIIGVLSSVLVLLTGETFSVLLFGKSFGASIPLINLICYFLLPFWPITMLLGSILIYYDYDKYYLKSTIYYGILVLILVPVLIFLFGINGAIYAIGLSNFVVIIFCFYFIKKIIPGLFSNK